MLPPNTSTVRPLSPGPVPTVVVKGLGAAVSQVVTLPTVAQSACAGVPYIAPAPTETSATALEDRNSLCSLILSIRPPGFASPRSGATDRGPPVASYFKLCDSCLRNQVDFRALGGIAAFRRKNVDGSQRPNRSWCQHNVQTHK
jgi:hypothetical protein